MSLVQLGTPRHEQTVAIASESSIPRVLCVLAVMGLVPQHGGNPSLGFTAQLVAGNAIISTFQQTAHRILTHEHAVVFASFD